VAASLPLIWDADAVCYAPAVVQDERRVVAKPGVIPAQSRYGEPPSGGSPVADPAVHARPFERKVGRHVQRIT